LERGEKIVQETRGYDEDKNKTYSQRIKEEAEDYRYFPEPDLPPLILYGPDGLFDLKDLERELPELPWQKKERILKLYGLNDQEANLMILEPYFLDYFEKAVSEAKTLVPESQWPQIQKTLYNYLTTDLKGLMMEYKSQINEIRIKPPQFAQLMALILEGKISSRVAKDLLSEMFKTGRSASEIMKEKKLETITDQQILIETVNSVIENNPQAVNDYLNGKESAIQFLVGQSMAKLKGAANPKELEKMLREKLRS
jgi:aspartyl-tRNA(Asn)/glutamyl-tRNA(Gln) amidotransferase subunit B